MVSSNSKLSGNRINHSFYSFPELNYRVFGHTCSSANVTQLFCFNSIITRTMIKLFLQLFSVLLLLWPNFHASNCNKNIINHLPGYPDELPFQLETGYVGVGEMEEVQLFYYFIESESDPHRDPLLLWLTGGPGCSAFSGLVLEIGPLKLNVSSPNWKTEAPKFQSNPYSWTKVASIVFLDVPVGTGFSYATTFGGYYSDDIMQSSHVYEFIRKWLVDHAQYSDNHLYISGDSYGGKIVPIVVQNIIKGNEVGLAPKLNFKGYIIGNPMTTIEDLSTTSKFEYARRMSLIPDELYESCKRSCNGTYVDAHNMKCKRVVQAILNNLDPLIGTHVLEPNCVTPQTPCRDASYELLNTWANNIFVQEALQIREGTKSEWIRCNRSVAYAFNVKSTEGYHQNFVKESMNALVYSGDQDLLVPYVGTLGWIKNLNVSTTDDWRPWFVAGQVAGYTTKSSNGHYNLTFATVKGAGHTAPEYKRQECLTMITKWLAASPL